ncbi:MAG: toll/interleukin-1 receptor domain-containing protein [Phycisphaerales bacterium]
MKRLDIVNRVHENLGFFQKQCRAFSNHVEAYADRLIERCERKRAELSERVGEKAFHGVIQDGFATSPAIRLLDKEEAAGPPTLGWVWSTDNDCIGLSWTPVRSNWLPHWRPPEEGNPLLWFATSNEARRDAYVFPGYGMVPQHQVLHDAVLLSIAHDHDPLLSKSEPRVFDGVQAGHYWCRDEFCRTVWNALMQEGGEERLERAWMRVKPRAENSHCQGDSANDRTFGNACSDPIPQETPGLSGRSMEWDVFISHASEDKDTFVRRLAETLQQRNIRVWYADFTLTVGDSLRRSIDKGLASSRYGIVVISPDFLKKEWPQKELDGLVGREADGRKVILPIWHNVDADTVRRFSPLLADRVATSTAKGLDQVVVDLMKAMK